MELIFVAVVSIINGFLLVIQFIALRKVWRLNRPKKRWRYCRNCEVYRAV